MCICNHSALVYNKNNFIDVTSFKISLPQWKHAIIRSSNEHMHMAVKSRWVIAFDCFSFTISSIRARTSFVRWMLHESSAMSLNAAMVKWILRSCLLITGACLLTTESVQYRLGRGRRKITFYYINHSKLMWLYVLYISILNIPLLTA